MEERELRIGAYELRNCLASGNVSQIWEVVKPGGTQHFAMKLLLPDAMTDRVNTATLEHEFKVGKSLDHPNIIRFDNIELNRDHAFFVMDYFRAPSLKSQISHRLTDVRLRFGKLVESVVRALSDMHEQGWLHTGIRPEHILMNRRSEVKLIDFSRAARKKGALWKRAKVRAVQGTRTYSAPETLRKKRPTEQTDIYSLGITLYEALVGHPPFVGTSSNDLLQKQLFEEPVEPSFSEPNITPETDAFILHLLRKNPRDRPADMNELYAEFCSIPKLFRDDRPDRPR